MIKGIKQKKLTIITRIILLHEKFLQFDWFRAVAFSFEIPTCENFKTFAGW